LKRLLLSEHDVCRQILGMIVIGDESNGPSERHDPERLLVDDGTQVKARLRLVLRVHVVDLRLAVHFDGARVEVFVVPLIQVTRARKRALVTPDVRMNLAEPVDRDDSIVKKEIRTARGARDESEKPRRGAFVGRSPGASKTLDRAAFRRVYVLPNGFAEDVGFDGRGYNRCGLHGRLQKRIVRELLLRELFHSINCIRASFIHVPIAPYKSMTVRTHVLKLILKFG